MPNINHHPITKHRAQTGRFLQAKSRQELKNQLDLERAIIRNTSNSSVSFSSTVQLNKSALVTGLLATMALSAVIMPCVQSTSVQTSSIKEPEPEFAPDPLPPQAIKGGRAINDTPQSKCLISLSISGNRRCSGTAIAPNVVLTAQHCVADYATKPNFHLLKVLGSRDLIVQKVDGDRSKDILSGKKDHEVEAIYLADGLWIDDQYTYNTPVKTENSAYSKQDLAILKLKTSIDCTPYYQLPTEEIIIKSFNQCKDRKGDGGNFTIRGYGKVNLDLNSNFAREANVECVNWISWMGVTDLSVKGGAYTLTNSKKEFARAGDSGGPLVCDIEGQEYQVGVARGSNEYYGFSVYSSLKGRIDAIKEIIEKGHTPQMLKAGCVNLYSHFSPFWESSRRITLTNTCQQTEQVILAMGEFNKGGIMVDESVDLEHYRRKMILKPNQSLSYAISKNIKPVFPFSRSFSIQQTT